MFLIIHNQDKSSLQFLSYLNAMKAQYISLTLTDLIQDVSIIDKLENTHNECVWKYKENIINFSEITGLLNCVRYINIEHFNDYIEEDQLYVQNEWWAYFVYRINSTKNCINKITSEVMSGVIYQFPFIFSVAVECGFSVPFYAISTDFIWLKNLSQEYKFISRNDLTSNYDFRQSNNLDNEAIGFIEYSEGNPIFLHIINNTIIGCIKINDVFEEYRISSDIIEKCNKLQNKLNLEFFEILLKQNLNGDITLYNISIFPNITMHPTYSQTKIFEQLHNKLSCI